MPGVLPRARLLALLSLIPGTLCLPASLPALPRHCAAGSCGEATWQAMAQSLPVVVVGGGLAGLSAAAELAAAGTPVVVIEKTDRLGGNSAKASSGMNAAASGPQKAAGIEDSPDLFLDDIIKSGQGLSTPALAEVAAAHSADAVAFLEGFGVNLSSIQQLGGHSRPRTHRAAPDGKPMNIGFRIMSALIAHCQELQATDPDKMRILTHARATELLTADMGGTDSAGAAARGRVVGVKVAKTGEGGTEVYEDIWASAVILATGGFSADREGLLRDHAPCLRQLPTTNGPFATGDGVRLGEGVGAALVHMDQVQVHPTGLVDPKDPSNPVKILGPEVLRGSGGVMLNSLGQRFVDELSTRDKVVSAMWEHCSPLNASATVAACSSAIAGDSAAEGASSVPPGAQCCPVPSVVAHLLLTQAALTRFGEAPAKFYLFKGLMRKFANLAELCAELGLPEAQVRATLAEYDRAADVSADSPEVATLDPFGKTVFPVTFRANLAPAGGNEEPPLYSAVVTPVVHYTMGGLRFDSLGHVLRPSAADSAAADVIPGLLAAGEVTGGLHGANRLAGNSLLECVVYGRIAAKTAIAEVAEQRDMLSPKEGDQHESSVRITRESESAQGKHAENEEKVEL